MMTAISVAKGPSLLRSWRHAMHRLPLRPDHAASAVAGRQIHRN